MSGQKIVTPSAENLAAAASEVAENGGLPPVHLWNPPLSGEMDMVIRRDGSWVHEGRVIERAPLVRLFSTILRRDGDDYVLVTPVEKWRIRVEDAPFVAVDVDRQGDAVVFTTKVDSHVAAGPDNPVRLEHGGAEPSPYVHVRGGMEARLDRKTYYRMVALGETRSHEGEEWFGLASNGAFFPLIRAAELP